MPGNTGVVTALLASWDIALRPMTKKENVYFSIDVTSGMAILKTEKRNNNAAKSRLDKA